MGLMKWIMLQECKEWNILKLKNQSGFQGFCGPIKIYKFQDLQRFLN